MSLRVDAKFSGGNVAAVRVQQNETHPKIFFTANPCGGAQALWFNFRVSKTEPEAPHPESIALTLEFAQNLSGCDSPADLHPVFRGEGQG